MKQELKTRLKKLEQAIASQGDLMVEDIGAGLYRSPSGRIYRDPDLRTMSTRFGRVIVWDLKVPEEQP